MKLKNSKMTLIFYSVWKTAAAAAAFQVKIENWRKLNKF